MTPEDHIALIAEGVRGSAFGEAGENALRRRPGVWADLGSGTGAFTIALATLLGGEGKILSVDKDARALRGQEAALRTRFPRLAVELVARDFTALTGISDLDGVLMANSLHYHRDAPGFLERVSTWLRPAGTLIVVEYDIELPNPWVPHPVSYRRFARIAPPAGFSGVRLLGTRPSRYHRQVYAAAAAAGLTTG